MPFLMQVAVEYGALTSNGVLLGLRRQIAEVGPGTTLLVAAGLACIALLILRR
jgi:hypothetical protein